MLLDFLFNYGLFFLKFFTVIALVGLLLLIVVGSLTRAKPDAAGHLELKKLNDRLESDRDFLKNALLEPAAAEKEKKKKKAEAKAERKAAKKALKKAEPEDKGEPKTFVLEFKGDIQASAVAQLRREITALLQVAQEDDEVVVLLESGGGVVHSYGLASSQLLRIKKAGLKLTVCVDRVAASGGYMMACVAEKVVAAPFAIMGSIGVVAQIPNFHRLLKKNEIDVELLTAGEHKRTLTLFGENTEKGREKFLEDLADTHDLFKDFVQEQRPQLAVSEVATGEVWYGTRALERGLIDELATSDDYLVSACEKGDVYTLSFVQKKNLPEALSKVIESSLTRVFSRIWQRGVARGFEQ